MQENIGNNADVWFLTNQLLITFQIPTYMYISEKSFQNWPNIPHQHLDNLKLLLPYHYFFHFCFIQNMTQVGRVHDLVQQRSAELPGVDNSPLTTLQQQHQLFFKCFHFWESQNTLTLEK